jgi:uroporphyrinogen-III decarboxylase
MWERSSVEESMNSIERIYAAINLKEADRVPADPLNIYILAYYGGISIREFMTEPVKMVEATERAREKIGKGDQVYPPVLTLDHLSFLPISLKYPQDKVKDVEVLLTIVEGKEIYRSDNF